MHCFCSPLHYYNKLQHNALLVIILWNCLAITIDKFCSVFVLGNHVTEKKSNLDSGVKASYYVLNNLNDFNQFNSGGFYSNYNTVGSVSSTTSPFTGSASIKTKPNASQNAYR